eukprot:CAMPEP_0202340558 /NCGR_PEP_ID=MMETSP1126-20121109/1948_1 /ASSEMBLY_ACC=CAM_ASM_000457 /TAXON_ID=3047 /ORGANISM="Dunaliella tertiolecta, Strain CCMP1320" /LENGTH=280 /DNA_ID=CAMNT_0048931285 /DNA_START=28 /DNA_END=871 /DNA_ORIENTATION=+
MPASPNLSCSCPSPMKACSHGLHAQEIQDVIFQKRLQLIVFQPLKAAQNDLLPLQYGMLPALDAAELQQLWRPLFLLTSAAVQANCAVLPLLHPEQAAPDSKLWSPGFLEGKQEKRWAAAGPCEPSPGQAGTSCHPHQRSLTLLGPFSGTGDAVRWAKTPSSRLQAVRHAAEADGFGRLESVAAVPDVLLQVEGQLPQQMRKVAALMGLWLSLLQTAAAATAGIPMWACILHDALQSLNQTCSPVSSSGKHAQFGLLYRGGEGDPGDKEPFRAGGASAAR